MSIHGTFTVQGLALAAKVAAGTRLVITKAAAGSGVTPADATALADVRQTLSVGTAVTEGTTAVMPVTLMEAEAQESYPLRELGIYASDPGRGEILYQVFRLTEPANIVSGGTAVYRFDLRQLVGQKEPLICCAPTGVLLDADLAPTRKKVLALSVPALEASVAASALPGYLRSLPRLLTDHFRLTVTGDLAADLELKDFYGSGSLTILAGEGGCRLQGQVRVENCRCSVAFRGVAFAHAGGTAIEDNDPDTAHVALTVTGGAQVLADRCAFTGDQTGIGMSVGAFSRAVLKDCTIQSQAFAVLARQGGFAVVDCAQSTDTANNISGAWVYHGGIIQLSQTTSILLGGGAHRKEGGMIVRPNGTLA